MENTSRRYSRASPTGEAQFKIFNWVLSQSTIIGAAFAFFKINYGYPLLVNMFSKESQVVAPYLRSNKFIPKTSRPQHREGILGPSVLPRGIEQQTLGVRGYSKSPNDGDG